MCGLTGFWSPLRPTEEEGRELLQRMTEAVRHRGPDDVGVWYGARDGVGLGHRRLSIVDLSVEGHQPMTSATGRYTIVFNGEVYNFSSLRQELEQGGARFRGGSDTEVMLAAIERWGVSAATQRFIGMFAFALWDKQERTLHLVRDRLGIKPLYYSATANGLLFASELSALRRSPEFSPDIDVQALRAFFQFGYVPTPCAIFRSARKLVPGTIATFKDPAQPPDIEVYWSVARVARRGRAMPFRGSLEEATDALESLLSDAVRLRMIADVPLGAFLSGGIDSSLVVAMMQRQGLGRVRTFSIGNQASLYDESASARAVASHLGTDHTAFEVTESDALEVAPRLGTMYDEPFADSSQIPTYLVSRLARGSVTVALSGDGGDELFGGYNRHLWAPRVLSALRLFPLDARRLAARALTRLPAQSWDRLYEAGSAFLPKVRLPGDKVHKLAGIFEATTPGALYAMLCSQWRDADELITPDLRPQLLPTPPPDAAFLADSFAAQMMFLDLVTYLPDDILTKVDRASMNVGLEARVPLIDHRVVEFAWALPDPLKIHRGVGKRLLRNLLTRYFPPGQFEGAKMGFGVPVGAWLRGPLKPWALDLLSPAMLKRSGLLSQEPIQSALQEHLSGMRDRTQELWTALMFVSWFEHQRMA